MHTFKPTAPAGDPRFATTGNRDAGLSAVEAELAAVGVGVGDSGSVRDSRWDDAIAVMILQDDKDDDLCSLKDELDLFRRENDFDLD